MRSDWSKNEIKLILDAYLQMLNLEINGKDYNKAQFNRDLLVRLNNRSRGSIEFKHQNISAILMKYNMPYIVGYKPRSNYQHLLEDIILEYLAYKNELDNLLEKFSEPSYTAKPELFDPSTFLVKPPTPLQLGDPRPEYKRKLNKPNYLAIEQSNKTLGQSGEELVIQYEKWYLNQLDKPSLAESVEWTSKDKGDGAGFDIISKYENGKDKYIEVKTTKLGELTPFYFTRNELEFSRDNSSDFFLYRVFKLYQSPRMFAKKGSFDSICNYEPTNFIGRIN